VRMPPWVSPVRAARKAGPMDITTVNDRHLYQGRLVVQDPEDPSRPIVVPGRILRFGPAGWVTVMAGSGEDAEIEVYPTSRVLVVTDLREVAAAGRQPGRAG
jgi:hypothetical protein